MSYCRQVTSSLVRPAIVPAILIFALYSCRVPIDFPRGKPFVYKTTVKVVGDMKGAPKQDITQRLESQVDDSLQTKTITAFNWPHILIKRLSNPPVYDSTSLSRSIAFMNALMSSNGYYAPVIKDTVIYKTVNEGKTKKSGKNKGESLEEQRVIVHFLVQPGKQLVFDSIGFSLETPELQQITIRSKEQSLIKVGQPYSRQVLTNEINRLVDSFRNQGYYRFTKEDLYAEQDTVFAALIDPSLDPIEQAELLEKLKQKKENPSVTVVIRERQVRDSTHLMKYYIGDVTVYPDLPVGQDTLAFQNDTTIIHQIKFISRTNKFKIPFLADNIYLYPGGLYKQQNYYHTSNRLSQFSAWQYNNIEFAKSPVGDSLLDVLLRMYPAKKQKISVSLEASYNTNDIITTTNTFGNSLIISLQNRNAFRQSILTNTNLQGGVEFGDNFIQTVLTSLSHTVSIPHIIKIIPFLHFPANLEEKGYHTGTLINVNAGYTLRLNFFTEFTVNGSFGYEWSKAQLLTKKDKNILVTKSYLWKPINIENTTLPVQTDSFKNYLADNPPVALAFRPGLVIGEQFLYNLVRQKQNKTNYLLIGFEESGALLGFIKNLDKGPLLRYILGSIEFRHHIDYGNNQMVFRVFAGAGYDYGLSGSTTENTLPFFKAFYAGGPNSMRGWQIRNLGLGSSTYYTMLDETTNVTNLRFGDVKLEGNVEYRFLLGTLFSIKFRSAFYTDIGNIWSWQPIVAGPEGVGSDFRLNSFYNQFAVDAGTGLRLDFNYFILRFDYAYKLHDPQALAGQSDGWLFKLRDPGSGQLQLGINYPF
jgi:outer membrane protein insertion porin family